MLDFEPATRALGALITGVRDDQLSDPTPCTEATLADLIDHVDGFATAFTAAAEKDPARDGAPRADGTRLGTDWRTRSRRSSTPLPRRGGTRPRGTE